MFYRRFFIQIESLLNTVGCRKDERNLKFGLTKSHADLQPTYSDYDQP